MSLPAALKQGFTREAVEALSKYKKEPHWMTALRLTAWEAYTRVHPKNGHIPLQGLHAFAEPPTARVFSHDWPSHLQQALDERGDEEGLIVQRDSTILSRSISKEYSKKGVLFSDLDTALHAHPGLVHRYMGWLAPLKNPLDALAAAFWTGGTFLYVPRHVDVRLPFHSCLWMSSPKAALFSRALIIVEEGSRVSFVDECVSAGWQTPGLAVEVLEAFVGWKSYVECLRLEHFGKSVTYHRLEASEVAPTGRFLSRRLDQRLNTSLERAAELYPEVRV